MNTLLPTSHWAHLTWTIHVDWLINHPFPSLLLSLSPLSLSVCTCVLGRLIVFDTGIPLAWQVFNRACINLYHWRLCRLLGGHMWTIGITHGNNSTSIGSALLLERYWQLGSSGSSSPRLSNRRKPKKAPSFLPSGRRTAVVLELACPSLFFSL